MQNPSSPPSSPRTRVKICGITREQDALCVAEAGADAIGLVFYAPSPRAVTIEQAAKLIAVLPPFITTVGLFVNASKTEVDHCLKQVPLDVLQFHGEESPDYCADFDRPYIKAIRMREDINLQQIAHRYRQAQALLLDSYVKGIKGGTGSSFAWSRIPTDLNCPVVLAGGLETANVNTAIQQVQPWAVDVSGGVEQAKGIKSPDKIQTFMTAVMNENTTHG